MANCADCKHWVRERWTIYEAIEGSKPLVTFTAPDGHGECQALNTTTESTFGCNKYDVSMGDGIQRTIIKGEPWLHWSMIGCPECYAKGSSNDSPCSFCAGTGNVRQYIDGQIVSDRSRRHPMQPPELPRVDPATVLQPMEKGSAI